jgi:16S rRNA (cytosine967-C5)-methyltransferase
VARRTKGTLEPQVRAALHLGLHELLQGGGAGEHAAVSQAVELAKPSRGHRVVNAVLRRVQREGAELPADADAAGAAIRHGFPRWIAELWFEALGREEAIACMDASNAPGELALRVNTLVADRGRAIAGLGLGPDAEVGGEGELLVVPGRLDLAATEAFRSGAVVPQSRGAQLVGRWVDPQPGERVLDLCAAPGGKTTHLAALMGGEGEVVAVERHPGRAAALERTAERLRARSVRVACADATSADVGTGFDRVLLDPPCTGLGTLRSHPDLRWRMTSDRVPDLVALQDRLLEAARRALAPGGRLVYSTCTIDPAEERLRGAERRQLLPHRDGTDGFYLAREGA